MVFATHKTLASSPPLFIRGGPISCIPLHLIVIFYYFLLPATVPCFLSRNIASSSGCKEGDEIARSQIPRSCFRYNCPISTIDEKKIAGNPRKGFRASDYLVLSPTAAQSIMMKEARKWENRGPNQVQDIEERNLISS